MNDSAKELETITEQYYDEIYKYCRRRVNTDDIAYDITQNTFLALSERYSTINIGNIRKWLYETAKHKIADHYRELQKLKDNISDMSVSDIDTRINGLSYDPYNDLKDEDIEAIIQNIMSELESEDKELYIERFVKRLNYKALADKYEVSEQTVRKRVSRLRSRILKLLANLLSTIITLFL